MDHVGARSRRRRDGRDGGLRRGPPAATPTRVTATLSPVPNMPASPTPASPPAEAPNLASVRITWSGSRTSNSPLRWRFARATRRCTSREDRKGRGDPRRRGGPHAGRQPPGPRLAGDRAGPPRSRVLARRALPVRELHGRERPHPRHGVHDAARSPRRRRTRRPRRRAAVREPQRRQPRVRSGRAPVHRAGGRRERWRPPATASRCRRSWARCSGSSATHRWSPLRHPSRQPVRRPPGGATGDLGDRLPQSVAVLVRPSHRRPLDRGRRSELVGGDLRGARGVRRGANFGWNILEEPRIRR